MTDLRDDIASVIEDAIDSVHDMDVTHADYARAAADALIAAPDLHRIFADQTAEIVRLRSVLEDVVHDCQAEYPPSHWAIKRYVESVLQVKP